MSQNLRKVLSFMLAVLTLVCAVPFGGIVRADDSRDVIGSTPRISLSDLLAGEEPPIGILPVVQANDDGSGDAIKAYYSDTSLASMRKRADDMVNYKWTPVTDIYTWNGNEYNGSTVFKKGVQVTGMPYTMFAWEDNILPQRTYKWYAKSYNDKNCGFSSSTRKGPCYGSCCASFICEVFGGNYMEPALYQAEGEIKAKYFSTLGFNSTNSTIIDNAKANQIQIGDALISDDGEHIIWVYDLNSTRVTISEQTPPVAVKTVKNLSNCVDSSGNFCWDTKVYKKIVRPAMSGSSTAASNLSESYKGIYTTYDVNTKLLIRKEEKAGSAVVAEIPKGAYFEITKANGTKSGDHGYARYTNAAGETVEGYILDMYYTQKVADVSKDAYYYNAVLWAYTYGITAGTTTTTFAPAGSCDRAQVVTFLWRVFGSPEPKTTDNPFTDVSENRYYYKPVLWAVENGITVGTSTTTFSPSKKCTRGEIATFIWRACGSPDPKATSMSFNDVESNRFYYKPVLWADESKFFKGVDSIVYTNDSGIAVTDAGWPRSFGPSKNCPRSLVVHMLYKMASYVPDSHNCDYGCSAKNAGYYTIIANGGLFLRDDHNTTTSNKLVLMKEGYKVYVEKATDGFTKVDWAHVKYTDDNGKVWQGYACKKYLQKVNNDGGTQTGDWAWPMKGYYVSGNDWMTKTDRSRPYHLGIDIATKSDSNVYAAAAGTVVSCDDNYANGNYVIIKHVIGGKTVYSFYAHLSSYVSGLSGKTVAKGDKIGVYGDTGNFSKGAHLHFAIVDTCWSSGGYFGYGPTYTSNDKVSYEGVYYYNPRYVIENNKLP